MCIAEFIKRVSQSFSIKICLILFALGLTTILLRPLSAVLATSDSLALGKFEYKRGHYSQAIRYFRDAVKADPLSCECHLCLGRALCKDASGKKQGTASQVQEYKAGTFELRLAIRTGRGSVNSVTANALLLTLPQWVIAPKTGVDTPRIAAVNGIPGGERGLTGEEAKPKVLEFYASWCEPCKKLKPIIEKAKVEYGEKIEFISYNVDDPDTEKVIEDYEVSPIPTLIFLAQDNRVVGYSIGFAGEQSLQKGIQKILL